MIWSKIKSRSVRLQILQNHGHGRYKSMVFPSHFLPILPLFLGGDGDQCPRAWIKQDSLCDVVMMMS